MAASSPDELANALWISLPPPPVANKAITPKPLAPKDKIAQTQNKIGPNVVISYEGVNTSDRIGLSLIENPALAAAALNSSEMMERNDRGHMYTFTRYKAAGKYDAIVGYLTASPKDSTAQIRVTDEHGTARFAITLGITTVVPANQSEVMHWIDQVMDSLPYAQLLNVKRP
jgi:hypothetical protein